MKISNEFLTTFVICLLSLGFIFSGFTAITGTAVLKNPINIVLEKENLKDGEGLNGKIIIDSTSILSTTEMIIIIDAQEIKRFELLNYFRSNNINFQQQNITGTDLKSINLEKPTEIEILGLVAAGKGKHKIIAQFVPGDIEGSAKFSVD